MPSRRRQRRPASATWPSASSKAGLERRARSTKSASASSGIESDGIRQVVSPGTRSASRLVTSRRSPGHFKSSSSASCAVASTTCSQPSRTRSSCRCFRCAASDSVIDCPGSSRTSSTVATACPTNLASFTWPISASQTPSAKSARSRLAARIASRVLPQPAAPVTLTSLLVTSREALRVPGETTWRIPSLSIPDEALALFVDRARLSNPAFELAEGQVAEAGLLCRRLDGIPLAIELAAAHVRMMSVGQILDRVEDRFRLLTGGSRTAVPRQQTMRAAVDWSYHHLEEAESRLFRRLSVFSGGFSADSLEAVCSDDSILASEILDVLSQLADKSLVVPEPRNGASFRYRLLETLSEYGREQLLESGEAETVWQRHATHFLQLAETAADDRIAEEHANLSGALEFLRTAQDERGLRLAVALVDFWDSAGHVSEGRERLQSLLQSVPADASLRARALDGAGWMAFRQADVVNARALFEQARALLAESGDSAELARVMSNLGMASVFSGDLDLAREHLEASLRVGRDAGAKKAVAGSLWVLGLVAYFAGNLEEAEARAVESLQLSEETGDRKLESFLRAALGIIAFERGQFEEAHRHLGESLEMSVAIGDRLNTALLLEGLCRLAAAESNWSLALRLGGAAAGLREAAGAQSIPLWQDRVDEACQKALTNLGQEAGTAVFEGGRSLEYIEAVSLARGSGESREAARSG